MGGFAWVTLATNDSYSLGALVLAHSLKQAGTTQQLAVLITPGVTNAMREKLHTVFNVVQEVNILDSRDEANLKLLKRPELGVTFTKLHCWQLTQYEKCVFLDADTLVLQNCDELFDREELSAAPDVGWPDCFNSGVFVYRPSKDTFEKLIQFALEKGSFDGGDQGLLNLYFSDWAHKDISRHLPFIYNMCSTACYSYLPAYKQFGGNAKIIHFIGATKPWLQYFNTETRKVQPSGDSGHLQDVLQRWWDIFCSLIHPQLSPNMPEGRSQQYYPNYPSHSQSHYYPPNETTQESSSASDFQNVYDPWDEYEAKQSEISQSNNQIHTITQESPSFHDFSHAQPNKSPNTNASFVAEHHSYHSQPQTHDASIHYTNQHNQTTTYSHDDGYHHHQPPIHQTSDLHYTTEFSHHNEPQVEYLEDIHHTTQYNYQLIESHNEGRQNIIYSQPYSEHIPQEQSINSNSQHTETHFHDPPPFKPQNDTQYHENHSHNNHDSSFYNENVQKRSPCPSPKRVSSPIPEIPNECKATDIVSNEVSVANSTEELDNANENAGLAGAFARLTLGVARTPEQDAFENVMRKQAWEVGNIDYMGKDSFENIWSKISETLAAVPVEVEPVEEVEELSKEVLKETPTKTETTVSIESPKSETPLPVSPKVELPAIPAVTDNIVSPPVQTSEPLKQEEPSKAEASIITAVLAAELPSPAAELKSESQTPAVEAQSDLKETKSEENIEAETVLEACILPAKVPEPVLPETPKAEEKSVYSVPEDSSAIPIAERTESVEKSKELASALPEVPKAPVEETKTIETSKEAVLVPAEVTKEDESAPLELSKPIKVPESENLQPTEVKPVVEPPLECKIPSETKSEPTEAEVPAVPVSKAKDVQASKLQPDEIKSELIAPKKPETQPTEKETESQPLESSLEQKLPPQSSQEVPQSKITEPTPPVTPSTPPVVTTPQLEKIKQALAVESNVLETPPPSSSQDDSPTPPPRKEGKPKKGAVKPKK